MYTNTIPDYIIFIVYNYLFLFWHYFISVIGSQTSCIFLCYCFIEVNAVVIILIIIFCYNLYIVFMSRIHSDYYKQ